MALFQIKPKVLWQRLTQSFRKTLRLDSGDWNTWAWKHAEWVTNGNLRNVTLRATGYTYNSAGGQVRCDVYYVDGTIDRYTQQINYAGNYETHYSYVDITTGKDKPIQKIWYEVGFKNFQGYVSIEIDFKTYEKKGDLRV